MPSRSPGEPSTLPYRSASGRNVASAEVAHCPEDVDEQTDRKRRDDHGYDKHGDRPAWSRRHRARIRLEVSSRAFSPGGGGLCSPEPQLRGTRVTLARGLMGEAGFPP